VVRGHRPNPPHALKTRAPAGNNKKLGLPIIRCKHQFAVRSWDVFHCRHFRHRIAGAAICSTNYEAAPELDANLFRFLCRSRNFSSSPGERGPMETGDHCGIRFLRIRGRPCASRCRWPICSSVYEHNRPDRGSLNGSVLFSGAELFPQASSFANRYLCTTVTQRSRTRRERSTGTKKKGTARLVSNGGGARPRPTVPTIAAIPKKRCRALIRPTNWKSSGFGNATASGRVIN